MNTTEPRVYVGTYHKYATGSIEGKWLDLEDYSDRSEFLEACAELHKDEIDPEFMFQDYEGFPAKFYSECSLEEELWGWLELDENERKMCEVYWENSDDSASIDDVRERFQGVYKNEEDWAYEFLDSTGDIAQIPERLRNYFDYAAYARDARLGGDCVFCEVSYDECYVYWNH